MAISEQVVKDAVFSLVTTEDVTKGKAGVLVTYAGSGGTIELADAANDTALGMFARDADSGLTAGVQLGEGSIVEFTAEGAVTAGDKLNPQGTAGDLGTCPNGAEYIGESLQTLADDESGVMLLTRGVKSGAKPQKTGTFTADNNIAAVFPVTGLYKIEVYIYNTTANAVTGGINIGTTSGGTDIASAQAVGANALVLVQDVVNITVAGTALYIETVTAWNSASLSVYAQPTLIA
jgi:hypothetical protein